MTKAKGTAVHCAYCSAVMRLDADYPDHFVPVCDRSEKLLRDQKYTEHLTSINGGGYVPLYSVMARGRAIGPRRERIDQTLDQMMMEALASEAPTGAGVQ